MRQGAADVQGEQDRDAGHRQRQHRGATSDRNAIATMRNTAGDGGEPRARAARTATMRPCSTRAGTEPVTPTTESSGVVVVGDEPLGRGDLVGEAHVGRGEQQRDDRGAVLRRAGEQAQGVDDRHGREDGLGVGVRPSLTARARARPWPARRRQALGLRCTTATRLSSGKPNLSNERISLCTAGLSADTSCSRSLPPLPMGGRYTRARPATASQNATTSQRSHTITRAYHCSSTLGRQRLRGTARSLIYALPRWRRGRVHSGASLFSSVRAAAWSLHG